MLANLLMTHAYFASQKQLFAAYGVHIHNLWKILLVISKHTSCGVLYVQVM